MSADQASFKLNELVDQLRRLSSEKKTGTMFIVTDDNHLARFVLRGGEILSLSFRSKRGVDAINFIKEIKSGKFKFDDKAPIVPDPSQELPSTERLFEILSRAGSIDVNTIPIAPDDPKFIRAAGMVKTELTAIMGPMAGIVCAEHLEDARTIDDISRVLDLIVEEIGDTKKEAQFRDRVLEQLRIIQFE